MLKPAIAVAFEACPRAQRRSRRPCEGAGGAGQSGGGGGQGAAPEVPGSQPPANSEFLRHELGRASVSTPAHPPLPAWAPPSAGWEALPRPRTPPSALLGDDHTPLSLPGLCLARKGTLWGVLAGGNALLPNQPSLDYPAAALRGLRGEGRRPSQLGQDSPSFLRRATGTQLKRTSTPGTLFPNSLRKTGSRSVSWHPGVPGIGLQSPSWLPQTMGQGHRGLESTHAKPDRAAADSSPLSLETETPLLFPPSSPPFPHKAGAYTRFFLLPSAELLPLLKRTPRVLKGKSVRFPERPTGRWPPSQPSPRGPHLLSRWYLHTLLRPTGRLVRC